MYEKARDTAVGAAAAAGEGAQNLKDRVMGPSTGTGTGMGYSSGTHTGTGTGYSSGTRCVLACPLAVGQQCWGRFCA